MSLLDADQVSELPESTVQQGPPRSKKKTLACKRCRRRKQKCTETRPCENCTLSGAECIASEAAAIARPLEGSYVQRLEERVAELEALLPRESVDHISAAHGDRHPVVAHDLHQQQPPTPESPRDVLGQVSRGLYGAVAAVCNAHAPLHPYSSPSGRSEPPPVDAPAVGPDLKRFLVQTYFDMAQSQYPVLLRHEFLDWAASWHHRGNDVLPATATRWKGFSVYMVYAIAFVMTKARVNGPARSRDFYLLASSSQSLAPVLDHPDPLLRAQALLLLTIYALHMPSRDHIIPLASRAVRFCVEHQLHLADTEPAPTDGRALVPIQLRRRVFWCAYAVDRVVCGSYDLPVSIADRHITVPLFDNIDDDLLQRAATWSDSTSRDPPPLLTPSTAPTSVSSARHVIVGRQIQSEIQDMLLRRKFVPDASAAFAWRARMLAKLKAWNAQSRAAAEASQRGYASLRWHKMIYYYSIVTLHRPTRTIMTNPVPSSTPNDHTGRFAGSLVVQASCQALLLFRRFQMAREIAQPWLGLLSQFQIGVTLLYCFLPRRPRYGPTLAVLADRWVEAECVRDVFDVLAREVPFASDASGDRPDRISDSGRAAIAACMPAMRKIVMDRLTLRMIHEMMHDRFADDDAQAPPVLDGTIVVAGSATTPASATRHDPPFAPSDASSSVRGATTSAAAIFEGMDLQWGHLTHASSLEMEAQFHLPPDMDTTVDATHFLRGC